MTSALASTSRWERLARTEFERSRLAWGHSFIRGPHHRLSYSVPQPRRLLSSNWAWRSELIATPRITEMCSFRNGCFPMTIALSSMSPDKKAGLIGTRSITKKPGGSFQSNPFSNCSRRTHGGRARFRDSLRGMLSGGSRIRSQLYLRGLLAAVTGGAGPGGYVGGEMEGVGLLAASEKAKPVWIVVKGISDFADDKQRDDVRNAAGGGVPQRR